MSQAIKNEDKKHKSSNETIEELYTSDYLQLVNHGTAIVKSRADAEDIASESFLKMRERHEKVEINDPKAYLYKINANSCLKFLDKAEQKKTRQLIEGDCDAFQACENSNPETITENQQLSDAITKAIETLPTQERRAIELKYAGHNDTEIAEKMEKKVNTIRTHLKRAMQKLRILLEPYAKERGFQNKK